MGYDTGEMVQLGDDVRVPRYVRFDVDERSLPCRVRGWVENTRTGPRIVEMRLAARPGKPISAVMLREIPVRRILQFVEATQVVLHPVAGGAWGASAGPQSGRDRLAYRRARAREESQGRRWRLTDDHLGKVAEVYRRALATGRPPTGAVADHFGLMNRATAGRWVREARLQGQLGPAPGPRQQGEQS